MIVLRDRKACTGCTACAAACPLQCIRMEADREGFLYPVIDEAACVHCGLCEEACPVGRTGRDLQGKKQKEHEERAGQDAYVLQHRDQEICRESTSGGAFTAVAEWIIERGGVVFGAAMQEDLTVRHIPVQDKEGLWKFRNSKYVQSAVGDTFREARAFLEEGRWVCYSGTPCQIEGFRAFLGKDYETLLCVDIVCRAVPSPMILRKYIEMQQECVGDFAKIRFRDKHHGYKYSALALFDCSGKKVYARGIDSDQMLRAFFSNICVRPSCYHCQFKKRYRVSDLTLWDCFDVFLFDRKMDNDRGATSVLIQSDRGRQVLEQIRDRVRCVPVPADRLTEGMTEMVQSVPENPAREAFFDDAVRLSGKELFTLYFPETMKVRFARFLRSSMCTIGIYAPVNRFYKRLKRKKRAAAQRKNSRNMS